MRALIPIIAVSLLLTAFLGLAIVSWLPPDWRRLMLPAVPLVGAMALAVGLHATGLVVGVRLGLPALTGLAVVTLGVRSIRNRWWQDLTSWPWLLLGLAAGAVFVWVGLTPVRPFGAALVEPGGSQDAFGYVTNSAWLIDHPLVQHPDSNSAPTWGYTRNVMDLGLRQGEEVDQAAVAVSTGRDPMQTFYAVSTGWLLLLPGGLIATASVLGLRPTTGLMAGAIVSGSSLVMSQVIFSNSAALLGLAMAPLALALATRYIDDSSGGRDGGMVPAWFAAGALAALAATYTEFLPLVAPGLVAYTVVTRRTPSRRAMAGLRLVGVSLLISPLGWFRAIKSLLVSTALVGSPREPGPFLNVPLHEVTSHYGGTLALLKPGGDRFSYILIGVLAIGIAASVALSPARRFFAAVLGSVAFGVILLSTVHPFAYGQARALEITGPLVVLAGVAGYAALAGWLRRRRRGHVFVVPTAAAAAVVAAIALVVNHNTNMPYLQPLARPFASKFVAARQWLTAAAGPHGENSMVLDTETGDQVWLQYELRELGGVQFPYIVPFYSDGGPPLRFFDGRPRRFAVVEAGMLMHVDPSAVVGKAENLLFLDLSRGSGVLALGATGFNPLAIEAGGPEQGMVDEGDVILFHDPGVNRVVLRMRAMRELAPVSVRLTAAGIAQQTVVVGASPTDVTLTLPIGHPIALHLHNLRPGAAVTADPRQESISLVSVRPAP